MQKNCAIFCENKCNTGSVGNTKILLYNFVYIAQFCEQYWNVSVCKCSYQSPMHNPFLFTLSRRIKASYVCAPIITQAGPGTEAARDASRRSRPRRQLCPAVTAQANRALAFPAGRGPPRPTFPLGRPKCRTHESRVTRDSQSRGHESRVTVTDGWQRLEIQLKLTSVWTRELDCLLGPLLRLL